MKYLENCGQLESLLFLWLECVIYSVSIFSWKKEATNKIASIASPTTSSSYYVGFIWTAWTIHIRNLLMDGTFLFNAVHLKWEGIAIILFCRSTLTFSPSFQFSIAAFSCPSNKSGIKWTKNVIENSFFLLKHFSCPFISSTPIYPCWMSQSICRLSPQNPLWNQLKF
jgi:hypothetical protein